MAVLEHIDGWRSWFPIPTENGRIHLGRWVLLEANRIAVTAALLTLTFVSIIVIGTLWTFELQRLFTETQAVVTILDTMLSGIILLVSIVVSINSIVLSYDIASVSNKEDRIESAMEFRREIGRFGGANRSPTDPSSFLQVMAESIQERARALQKIAEDDDQFTQDVQDHVETIVGTVTKLEDSLQRAGGGEFAVLWLGLETDYGPLINQSRQLTTTQTEQMSERAEDRFTELLRSLEMFATGREHFKTLYYSREIAELSRILLIISLPAIISTASTILAINADLVPELSLFGIPSLLTFTAIAFTISLAPFIVLTAYMLRVATVAYETASSGPFVLQ